MDLKLLISRQSKIPGKVRTKEKKIIIPKDFIKKIKKLGLKEDDAQTLFESKIDWTAVYAENKLYCTELTCDFFTTIDNEEMQKHMINVHKYGKYSCGDSYCNYVGHSEKIVRIHRRIHKKHAHQSFFFKCPRPTCGSSFQRRPLLDS